MAKFIITLIILINSSICIANDSCDLINEQIDNCLKNMAYNIADGNIDNSAPRETIRQIRKSNELNSIIIYLKQAEMNKCNIKPFVSSEIPYLKSANDRFTAKLLMGEKISYEKASKLCDTDNWIKQMPYSNNSDTEQSNSENNIGDVDSKNDEVFDFTKKIDLIKSIKKK